MVVGKAACGCLQTQPLPPGTAVWFCVQRVHSGGSCLHGIQPSALQAPPPQRLSWRLVYKLLVLIQDLKPGFFALDAKCSVCALTMGVFSPPPNIREEGRGFQPPPPTSGRKAEA